MTDLYQRQGGEFLVNSETANFQYNPKVTGLTNGGFVVTWWTDDSTQDGSGYAIKAQVFAADGSTVGGEVLVNSETANNQYYPTVTGLTNGGFVVTWQTNDSSQDGSGLAIKAQVFAADGSAVGGEFLVNSETASNQVVPTITGLTNGGFVVTWYTNDGTQDGSGSAIKAQVFAADGSAVGNEFLVNSETAGSQYTPTVTGLTNGGFVVTWWTNDGTQDGSGLAIKAQVFAADGSPQGGEVLVNSETAGNQYDPTITGLTNGGFVVTWWTNDGTQDGSGSAIKAQVFAADGSAVGGEVLVNSEPTGFQYDPTITSLINGGFVATWWTSNQSYDGNGRATMAQVFAADGSAVGGEVLVNSETAGSQYDPTITGLTNGGFVVVWRTDDSSQDGSNSAIKAQIYQVVPENTAPTITSSATVTVDENTTDVMDVDATDDTDSESAGLSYALTGGADAALFDIDTATGELSFLSAPDFETPGDDDGDNTYDVQVTVTDSGGLADVQDIAVTVADVAENGAPTITSSATVSIDENTTSVVDVEATDDTDTEGSGLTYALTGGADAALFDIDTATGELSFLSAPDFETPGDDDGDNTYDVQVTVTDSGGLTDVQDIAVTVADVAENTAPAFGFVQGFETDTAGFFSPEGYGAVTRVSSGTGGLASPEGGFHAVFEQGGDPGSESGPFTRFDGYRNEWPGEWTASVQVWLDTGWAAGEGFDYSVAANGTDGQHYRDYIFHVTQDTSTGDLLVGISNNSNFDPQENLEAGDHGVVSTTGWYTLEHRFYDDGGVLAVEMRVLDAEGVEVFSGTRSNPADTVGAGGVVGGNRYGWFTNIDIADGIEVDGFDLRLGENAQDTGAVTELAAGDPDAETLTHVAEGDLGFTDFDAGDTHTVSAAAQGAGYLGSFTATVSEATATDGVGTVTWSLEVADADLADLAEGETLVQDYVLTVEDSQGLTTTRTVSVTITGTNDGPTITSSATVSIDENTTDVMDVEATDDTDTEGSGLSYALTGGADAALFDIDTATGELSFLSAPDFETPGDDDGDNTYDVQVTVTDSGGLTDVQDIAVTVADVAENGAPTITSSATVTVDENTTDVMDVEATDDTDTEGSGLTYALTGGADAALFDIDMATGELSFLSAPDFETPGDDDGDNTYDVQVTVTDSGGLTDVQDIAVTVADVAENTAPAFGFVQGFETDTAGFFSPEGYGAVTRVSSGTGGLASPEGGFHAVFEQGGDPGSESGPFTRFDGYRNEWPGDWTASVKVYLDTGWAAGEGFDYSVAANGTDGQHYRDYIFHVTQDTSTGDLLVGISNNSNFDPQENLETGDHGVVSTTGWYTLEHRFYDDGGVLAVEMRVLDAEGVEVFSGTRSNPADTVGAGGVVGGNRYGWFTNIDIADGIEVDGFDLRLGENAQDTGAVTELAAGDPDAETLTHVAEGDLGFTDVDAGDAHTVSAAAQGAGYLGSFTATVSEATATDGVGTVTWSLEVADADLADLAEGETLVQDYVLTVEDSGGLTTTRTVSVTITGTNDAPTITSSATVSIDENTTDVMDVDATDDTDTEGSGLSYALTGGADAALFDIDTATGELSFLTAPDFEAPGDDDGDNTYDVQVTVTDSGGLTDVQDIAVTVADVAENESPIAIGLVNTSTDTVVEEIMDGSTIDGGNLISPKNRGIIASYVADGDPDDDDGSIRFRLYDDQGGVVKQVTENDAPFALFGDMSGDFNNAWPHVTNGHYTLEVTAFSGNNRTGSVLAMDTIAFTVGSTPNTPPEAMDDFVEDVPGTSLFIDVLENDFDLNGDDLELVSVTQGSQGEVQIEGDQILYLRDTSGPAIFPGDSFTYTIDDGNGGLDTATVTIAPEASSSGPPVIAPLADLVADELDVVSVPVSATDPDGNETIALSVEVLRPNGQVASPNRYSLVDNGDGTGEFVWNTPSRNKDGNFTVNVTADDGENLPVTESFNILVEDTDDDVNTPEILYRVNAGGPQVAATDGGPAWGADTQANNSPHLVEPGSNSTANPGLPGGTSLPSDAPATVFETHRWDQPGSPEMAWEFDLPDDGFYMVRLFMRNNWNGADDAGERVFDVALEGSVPDAFEDIDPSGMFGHRVGGIVEAVVEVTDGTLGIEFRHQVQNPLVNALEITTTEDIFGV